MRHLSANILLISAAFGLVVLIAAPPVIAQKDARRAKPVASAPKSADAKKTDGKKPQTKRAGRVSLTPGREAAAMTFARLHHPELANLLAKLKKRKARQYSQALRQLFQTSERLARTQERSPDRYELELAAWKLDSRIRLLAARMTMNSDSKLDEKLKGLLKSRADVRLRQLGSERARLVERLSRVDALIEQIGSDPDASTLRELQRIKRSFAARGPRTKRSGARPVVAPVPRPTQSRGKSKKPL